MTIRTQIKRAVKFLFLLLAVPLYVLYRLLSLAGHPDSVFQSFSQFLSLIPGKAGVYLRGAFYRLACTNTSDDTCIGFLVLLSHQDTTLSKGVYVGPGCNVGKCSIGENTLLGSGVHVLSGNRQHHFTNPELPIKEQGGHFEKISIGTDCWLGNNSVVMVSLADKTLVAAGSVVTRTAEAGAILAGNPARVIGNRLKLEETTSVKGGNHGQ